MLELRTRMELGTTVNGTIRWTEETDLSQVYHVTGEHLKGLMEMKNNKQPTADDEKNLILVSPDNTWHADALIVALTRPPFSVLCLICREEKHAC